MAANREDQLQPIGEIVQSWEHFADHGELVVISHDVLYSIVIETYQCLECGRTFDVANDYDAIGPIEASIDA